MSLEVGQTTDRGGRFPVLGEAAGPDMDSPLIGDAAGLRASWQRIQAGFVDNPREAVADAAALVEHTAQVLVGTLRQRQQQLRGMWDTTTANSAAGTGAGAAGTRDASMTDRMRPTFTPATTPAHAADDSATDRGDTPGVSGTTDDDATADGDATDGGVRMADSGATPADGDATTDDEHTADSGVTTDRPPSAGGGPAAATNGGPASASPRVPDTEQLRILMQRYRSLFDQICPSL